MLGQVFQRDLVSDLYGGYTVYSGKASAAGCISFLCDLHALREATPTMWRWVAAVPPFYDVAQTFRHEATLSQEAREAQYVVLVEQAHALGVQYAQAAGHPYKALAKWILRHEDEVFQVCVGRRVEGGQQPGRTEHPPVVVVRKVSGGTQSRDESKTWLVLARLLETWQAPGLNPFEECLKLLRQTPLSQV